MAIILRKGLIGALSAAFLIVACGDDGDTPMSGGPDAAVAPSSMDGGPLNPSDINAPGPQLAAQVAGQPCTAETDCAGNKTECLNALSPLGSLGSLAGDLVAGLEVTYVAPGGYCSADCSADSACGEGGVCFGALGELLRGECRRTCATDADCREGYECAKLTGTGDAGGGLELPSTCQPRLVTTPLPADTVGKACTEATAVGMCGDGICANGACTGPCTTDIDCGAGAKCQLTLSYGTLGACVETCAQDADCHQYTGPGGGVGCIEGVCNAKVFPLDPGVVGNACTEDAQCGASGACATSVGLPARAAPGGYCSLQGCSETSQCGGGACIGSAFASRCYKSCAGEADCREGYTCQERMTIEGMPQSICAPTPPAADAGTM